MTSFETDGINEIAEGANRAISTAAMRWVEMLAWRGRDKAYEQASEANREVDQALAERDVAEGSRAVAERLETSVQERADAGWVSIPDPDDPRNPPIYEGGADKAASALVDGRYDALDRDDNPLTVTVADGVSNVVGDVDIRQRAEIHAETQAVLDSRDYYDGADVDAALHGWMQSRERLDDRPGPDDPHWRRWALLEADGDQWNAALNAVEDADPGVNKVAAAYYQLQTDVEYSARMDGQWRAAAHQRAAAAVESYATSQASQGQSTSHSSGVVAGPNTGDKGVDSGLLVHDMTFASKSALVLPNRQKRRSKPRTVGQEQGRRRNNPRATGR